MLINYIQGTIRLPLIMPIDKSGNIKWSVDVSFSMHQDMRIHMGGFTTIVAGRGIFTMQKIKLNTKSSIKDELVGVEVVLTEVIWTQ